MHADSELANFNVYNLGSPVVLSWSMGFLPCLKLNAYISICRIYVSHLYVSKYVLQIQKGRNAAFRVSFINSDLNIHHPC